LALFNAFIIPFYQMEQKNKHQKLQKAKAIPFDLAGLDT